MHLQKVMHNSEVKTMIREWNVCLKNEIRMTVILFHRQRMIENSGLLDYPLAATSTLWQDVGTKHPRTMQFQGRLVPRLILGGSWNCLA